MNALSEQLIAVDQSLRDLGRTTQGEGNTLVEQRRELEARLAASKPELEQLVAAVAVMQEAMARGETFEPSREQWFRTSLLFQTLYSGILERLLEIEASSTNVAGATEIRSLLRSLRDAWEPVARAIQEFAFHSVRSVGRGGGVRVQSRPGSPRLPAPPFETGEGPAPFNIPFLGPRVRVRSRPGVPRLPKPLKD